MKMLIIMSHRNTLKFLESPVEHSSEVKTTNHKLTTISCSLSEIVARSRHSFLSNVTTTETINLIVIAVV